jgi:hypothetical protein
MFLTVAFERAPGIIRVSMRQPTLIELKDPMCDLITVAGNTLAVPKPCLQETSSTV